jgi:hypothetical protein
LLTVFLWMVFCLFVFWRFSPKLTFLILFFNIGLVKNYSYNMWEKHYNFPRKLQWIAIIVFRTRFFSSFFCVLFFCNIFSQNYLCQFYFFNIELVENYNYKSLQIRLNHLGKHRSFHHKTLWIATMFPTWFFSLFFLLFFSKIVFVDYIFLILSLLKI